MASYVSPVTGRWADNSSNIFGAARGSAGRNHAGNDLHAPSGSPAVAVIGGTVIYAGRNKGYNWNAVVLGDDGYAYRYATHGPLAVTLGEKVDQGQKIGTIAGLDGGAPHLHFEVIPPTSPAFKAMVAHPGQFVSTQWWGRNQPVTIDPAKFFGIAPGSEIALGQPVGGAGNFQRDIAGNPVPPLDIPQGALDAAAATSPEPTLAFSPDTAPPITLPAIAGTSMATAPPPSPTDIMQPADRERMIQELNAIKNGPAAIPGVTAAVDAGVAGPSVAANMAMVPPRATSGGTLTAPYEPYASEATSGLAVSPEYGASGGTITAPFEPLPLPAGGPGTFPAAPMPAAPYGASGGTLTGPYDRFGAAATGMATAPPSFMPLGGPGTFASSGLPAAPALPAFLPPMSSADVQAMQAMKARDYGLQQLTEGRAERPSQITNYGDITTANSPLAASDLPELRYGASGGTLFAPYGASGGTIFPPYGASGGTITSPFENMATISPTSVPSTSYPERIRSPGFSSPIISLPSGATTGENFTPDAGPAIGQWLNMPEKFTYDVGSAASPMTNYYKPTYSTQEVNSSAYPPTLPPASPVTSTFPDTNTTAVEKNIATTAPTVPVVPAANPMMGSPPDAALVSPNFSPDPIFVAQNYDLIPNNAQFAAPVNLQPTAAPITQPAPPRPAPTVVPRAIIPAAVKAPIKQPSLFDKAMALLSTVRSGYGSASSVVGNTPGMQTTGYYPQTGSQQDYSLHNPNSYTYKPSNY